MELYRVISLATLGPGTIVSLDDRQFAMRRHAVDPLVDSEGKPVRDGDRQLVTTMDLAHFKAGEIIGLDGVLPKSLSDRMISATEDATLAKEVEAAKADGKPAPAMKKAGGKPSEPTKPVAAFPPQGEKARKKA